MLDRETDRIRRTFINRWGRSLVPLSMQDISHAEKTSLLREKVEHGLMPPEQTNPMVDVPLITEPACMKLRGDLHMVYSKERVNYERDEGLLHAEPPGGRALSMVMALLKHFPTEGEGSGFLKGLNGMVKGNKFFLNEPDLSNAFVAGTGLVLGAFVNQVGPEFLDRLKKADGPEMGYAFHRATTTYKQRGSLMDRIMIGMRIPDYQASLNSVIDDFGRYEPKCKEVIEDGAKAMYQVISELWPYLNPNSSGAKELPVS